MKMNKLYMGLLFTSASVFCGCSEYEDTETQSPQPDAEAIGANFPSEVINSTVTPDSTTFDVMMNRVNAESATSINVKTIENQKDFVSGPPTKFDFAAGKTSSTNSVKYDITKCTFQERDTLVLKIDAESKDHTYGAGYLQTLVDFGVDYRWKDSIDIIAEDKFISEEKFPIKIQFAMDFDKKKNKTRSLIRIQDYFKTAGKTTKDGVAHIQFTVNNVDREDPKLIWDDQNNLGANGIMNFNKKDIETGVSVEVTGYKEPVKLLMKELKVSKDNNPSTNDAEGNKPETVNVTYKVEYTLYYKDKDNNDTYYNVNNTVTDGKYSTKFTVNFPKVESAK